MGSKTSTEREHILKSCPFLRMIFPPLPLYHLASYEAECEAFVSCSMVQSLTLTPSSFNLIPPKFSKFKIPGKLAHNLSKGSLLVKKTRK